MVLVDREGKVARRLLEEILICCSAGTVTRT